MRDRAACLFLLVFAAKVYGTKETPAVRFETSDRCLACHNGLTTPSGADVSIGFDWRASIMANSSRDPYWQASVRRETIDHPEAAKHIEDECSVCHMPVTRYEAMLAGKPGEVFAHLPLDAGGNRTKQAADGVTCTVCHQISAQKLGTRESFNGGFVVARPDSRASRPEYGPFQIDRGQARIMNTSSGGFEPTENTDHIRKSEMCATCHTLYTTSLGPGGKEVGSIPEQVPYQEWLHSDYRTKQTCQDCHMPVVPEPAPITRVFGVPREGMKRHVFVAANFFVQRMLNRYRREIPVDALPQELEAAATYTLSFLKERAARVTIENARVEAGRLQADVVIENLGGHKLPTAYPSRRCWLHITVRGANDQVVFESGAIRPDGSIAGNDNDADPQRFEPHYTAITTAEQVQIYEDIMGDPEGRVTTGLLTAVRYLKDNRLLPHGFDKRTTDKDIAVIGEALADADFTTGGDRVRYSIDVGAARGPFRVEAELWYQPIGYRWANNLKPYGKAEEPRRFTGFFDGMASGSGMVLARAGFTAER